MAKRVEATGVTAYYGSFKAIDNINLRVEPKTV
ncbi:phosphate transport system ATP-binding protein, partial [Asanoa ishikariensis]